MKFRHIETAEVFNNTKFSADKHNRTYFIGNNDEITETGTPTVTFDEIVFCKELRILYTHGALYRNLIGKDTFLEQKSDLDLFTPYAEDGKIVEYIGPTDEKYVNGFIYQCIRADSASPMNGFRIQTSSDESIIPVDDIFYYQNDITDVAYVSDDRDYYSYTVPEVGSTVYRRGIRIITPYIVKSSVKVNSYWNGYDVTIYLPENPSYEKNIPLRNLYPGELWVNTHGLVVTAAPYRVFTGVVKVGNRHVSITTEPVMNSTVFWKQIIPLPKVIDPNFEQVIVNNTDYINSSDTNTIRFSESGNIKLTKAGDEIIIGNESEIDDSDISLTKTWSSDKLNRIIETLTEAGANNFRIVDELPTENIDTTSIYFVPAEDAEEGSNIKEEYVYINGQWELLGTTQMDLSGYYTSEQTDELFPTKNELYNNYYTNVDCDDTFVNKVTLNDYYKKSETDELLSEKQNNITAIEPLALDENSNLSIDLSAYDTIEDVNRKLAGKQDVIGGQNGEVIYHNGSDVFAQTLMSPGMVVTTEHDLAVCKATAPSFKTDASRLIFDTVHDSVWSFETVSGGGKAWVQLPNKKPITEMGVGRLNFNPVTKKLFYNNGVEIQELSTQYKGGDSISISEDNVISSTYTASDKKISLTRNGTELGSFTLNQATDKSIEIPGAVYTGGNAVNITSNNVVNVKYDDSTIKLDENGNLKAVVSGGEPGNGEVRIIHDSTDLCTFTLNQTANKELDLSNTYYNKAEVDSKIQSSQSQFTNSIVLISQDAYNALSTKDPNTLYLIAEVGG